MLTRLLHVFFSFLFTRQSVKIRVRLNFNCGREKKNVDFNVETTETTENKSIDLDKII